MEQLQSLGQLAEQSTQPQLPVILHITAHDALPEQAG
jgi:hypothetical protein